MGKKLKGRALSKFEDGRDVWQEVLVGVREIKSGGGKRSVVEPRSPNCPRASNGTEKQKQS